MTSSLSSLLSPIVKLLENHQLLAERFHNHHTQGHCLYSILSLILFVIAFKFIEDEIAGRPTSGRDLYSYSNELLI